jgi:transglutaminase-like putative cysteine protease
MSTRDKFRDPRYLLILIGIFCQGHCWDLWWPPLIYLGVALAVLVGASDKPRLGSLHQLCILVVAYAFIRRMAGSELQDVNNYIFFGGNGVYVYLLLLLSEPLNARQKAWSLGCALILIGIGTQVVVNFMAIPVLISSMILLPRSLYALQAAPFARAAASVGKTVVRKRDFALVGLIMLAFFLFFPRFPIAQRTAAFAGGVGKGPLDKKLDMAGSAGDSSRVIVLRVEGKDVAYLKSQAYDQFEDNIWKRSHWNKKDSRAWDWQPQGEVLKRTVKIYNYQLLSYDMPTDGYVHNCQGSQLSRCFVGGDGGVHVYEQFHRNETYSYQTSLRYPEPLDPKTRARNLALPPQTARLRQWLADTLGGETQPIAQAEILKQTFLADFQYALGVPDLDRLAPVDDFIFNAREGHCERYASALAVLLRMSGVPARVAVGYVAKERNEMGGFYNIRASDAHAWTEAWFEESGWTIVDATPYGQGIELTARPWYTTAWEWVENTWYSKIVEFNTDEQSMVMNLVQGGFSAAAETIASHASALPVPVLAIGIVLLAIRLRRKGLRLPRLHARTRAEQVREAQHFYGRMLRALARRRLVRSPQQTPREFLAMAEALRTPQLEEIRLVTDCFCDVRYGGAELDSEAESRLKAAVNAVIRGPR